MKLRATVILFLAIALGGGIWWLVTRHSHPGPVAPSIPEGVELSRTLGISIVRTHRVLGGLIGFRGGATPSSFQFLANGAPLKEILEVLIRFDGPYFYDTGFPDGFYNVVIDFPEGRDDWVFARETFSSVFGLEFVERNEITDILELRTRPGGPKNMSKASDDDNYFIGTHDTPDGFGYEARAIPMAKLAETVQRYVDQPVFDATGIEGYFTFTLSMNHWEPDTVHRGLEKLGLELVRAKRDIRVMRIMKRSCAASATSRDDS